MDTAEAERAVLCAVLVDPVSWDKIRDRLQPTDFSRVEFQRVYAAMTDAVDRGFEPERVVVETLLYEDGDDQDWTMVLNGILTGEGSFFSVDSYTALVEDGASLRSLSQGLERAIEETGGATSASAAVAAAESIIKGVRLPVGRATALSDVISEAIDTAGRRRVPGLRTGIPKLDAYLGGIYGGDLVLVAGRPSVGKTAFLLHLARKFASDGTGVGLVSLEMGNQQLAERLLSAESLVEGRYFRDMNVQADVATRMGAAVGEISELPILIASRGAERLSHLLSEVRQMVAADGIGCLVVDYIQLVLADGESRQEQVALVSRRLKALAMDLDIPIVAACQLSRSAVREERSPQLNDLRESGSLEQDADTVLMLYRKNEAVQSDVVCKIAKQRNGPIGSVRLHFKHQFGTFTGRD